MRPNINFDTINFSPQSNNEVILKVNYNVIPRVYCEKDGKKIEVNIPQTIFERIRTRASNLLQDTLDEVKIVKDSRGFYTIE